MRATRATLAAWSFLARSSAEPVGPLFPALLLVGLGIAAIARRPTPTPYLGADPEQAIEQWEKPLWVRFQLAQAVRTCDPETMVDVAEVLEPMGYHGDGAILRHAATWLEQAHRLFRSRVCAAITSDSDAELFYVENELRGRGEYQAADIIEDIRTILAEGRGEGRGMRGAAARRLRGRHAA